jgi:hypothetical protein
MCCVASSTTKKKREKRLLQLIAMTLLNFCLLLSLIARQTAFEFAVLGLDKNRLLANLIISKL